MTEENEPAPRRLVVFVPGLYWPGIFRVFRRRDWSSWHEVVYRLKAEPGHHQDTFKEWDHHVRPWSLEEMDQLAHQLQAEIDVWWKLAGDDSGAGGYDEIVLVGHSLGGLLIRHAFLLGQGEEAGYSKLRKQEWVDAVTRVVLLATPNRGFAPKNLSRRHRFVYRLARLVLRLTAKDLQQGSAYVTDLRIRWMRFFQAHPSDVRVVQMLGGDDELVNRDDSLDIEVLPTAAHISVPGTRHDDIFDTTHAERGEDRYQLIRRAVFGIYDPTIPEGFEAETDASVVFILHGIRAGKDRWVRHIKDAFKEDTPYGNDKKYVLFGPSYGRVSALSFALPFTRGKNLRFLQDRYSDYVARYPNATFHFIGHSNGTYLLGKALATVPAIRFNKVFLAGTVLPQDYDWSERFQARQVGTLRNDRSFKDRVVAYLCSALRGLRMRDVGTAGVFGFDKLDREIEGIVYPAGGHGGALEDDSLAGIVNFIHPSTQPTPQEQLLTPTGAPSRAIGFVARLIQSLVLFAIIGLVVLAVFMVIWFETVGALIVAAALLVVIFLLRTV